MTVTADGGSATNAAEPLSIYLHWPWCRSKCPYCDFNSYAADAIDQARWRDALVRELLTAGEATIHRPVTSIFFGGGTPSLMDPDTTAAIITAVRATWPCEPDIEITLEANPSTVETGRFRAFRDAGVSRVSIGVQSFDDDALTFLGRGHDAAGARRAVETAMATFPHVSFDLIYALPGQDLRVWQRQLDIALDLAGDHLSLYQLTIERGTAFHDAGVPAADEDSGASLYDETQDRLEAAGMPAYEVSNHARPGAECRHNRLIWQGGDYLGIGPGAHGRLTEAGRTTTTTRVPAPHHWLDAVERNGAAVARQVDLSQDERIEELLLLGLRLTEGVQRRRFRALTGRDIEDAVSPDAIADLTAGGYLILDTEGLRTTSTGRLCLNSVLAALLS